MTEILKSDYLASDNRLKLTDCQTFSMRRVYLRWFKVIVYQKFIINIDNVGLSNEVSRDIASRNMIEIQCESTDWGRPEVCEQDPSSSPWIKPWVHTLEI